METKKLVLMAGLAMIVTGSLFSVLMVRRQQAVAAEAQKRAGLLQSESKPTPIPTPNSAPVPVAVSPIQPETAAPEPPPKATVAAPRAQPSDTRPDVVPSQAPASQPTVSPKATALDPLAREALSFVGADPGSTAYWATAINNPFLPDEERKNLIEDLNEDGLSDPEHPAPEDMPLIANRIQLILELAPYAMDQVNAEAFAEAFKDLVALLDGQPAR